MRDASVDDVAPAMHASAPMLKIKRIFVCIQIRLINVDASKYEYTLLEILCYEKLLDKKQQLHSHCVRLFTSHRKKTLTSVNDFLMHAFHINQ